VLESSDQKAYNNFNSTLKSQALKQGTISSIQELGCSENKNSVLAQTIPHTSRIEDFSQSEIKRVQNNTTLKNKGLFTPPQADEQRETNERQI